MNIVDLSREKTPETITTEVCIVGSGCGGATAAWDLAAAGREVLILEEGGDFTGPALTQRDAPMYDQLYMDRGGRATDDLSVSILQGRALGGGGVINASDVVPLSEGALAFWQKRHGLTEYTAETLAPYTARALEDLFAGPIPDHLFNRNNQALERGAEAMGYAGERMLHNRVGCMGLGTCLIGCPRNAKKNPRFVAIPAALAAGARVLTRARAVRLLDTDQEMKRLTVRTLDAKGYHETGSFEVRAKIVIVAANPVNTAQLLLRSKVGNAHVGRHLSLQPQLPLIARFETPIEGFYGIPQSYAVTEFEEHHNEEHGLWGFRVETIMGTPGIVASLLPFTGIEGKERMTTYANLAASLLLTPDDPNGTVGLTKSGRPKVAYRQTKDLHDRYRAAVRATARMYLAAGAREVLMPGVPPFFCASEKELARIDAFEFAPAAVPLISAHQQGGVRMAPSAKDGAADPDGRVYGTRDVYVFDSSGFPSSSSSHTMAPIIAISHYLTDRLLARS